jgi:hypothetical protein
MTEAKKNIHQRLAEAMEVVSYIQKEKKQGMNYTIVSHDAVTAKVRPALLKAGIVYYPVRCEHTHNGNRAECSMTVRFVNIDEPSDYFEVPTFGYGIDTQDKGPGKAMSYAVKYALLKALGLETGDDADNESVQYSDVDVHQPPFNAKAAHDRISAKFNKAKDYKALVSAWNEEKDNVTKIGTEDRELGKALYELRDSLKEKLQPTENM